MKYVVSACLAGEPCRYDGKAQPQEWVQRLVVQGRAVPLCPELLGGLSVPRSPCEKRQSGVFTIDGSNCTEAFMVGAQEGLRLAKKHGCTAAILKARSPSCGSGQIYDGTFSHRIVPGDGLFAELLRHEGFPLFSEEHLPAEMGEETSSDAPVKTVAADPER